MIYNVFGEVSNWKKPFHRTKAYLARTYLKFLLNIKIVAITGSVGKTLTQNAISAVLSQKYKVVTGEENLDPTFRIPQTIFRTKPANGYLILEYGVEHPNDMDYYLSIVKPTIAIFTKISPTHTKYFGTEQGIFKEKSKLFANLSSKSIAFLNADDPYSSKLEQITKARIVWFGENASNSIKISHFHQDLNGSRFVLHYKGQRALVFWKIIGKHQLLSAYAAAALGLSCTLTLKQIAKGLSHTRPPAHRLNLVSTKNYKIIDDTYNSSPDAAKEAIATLLVIGEKRTKIAVLGEMKDLGYLSKKYHTALGKNIAKTKIDSLIVVGPVARYIATSAKVNNFQGKIYFVQNTQEAVVQIKKIAPKYSVILVKGSRHAHLERIVYSLQNKSRQINCYHCGYLI